MAGTENKPVSTPDWKRSSPPGDASPEAVAQWWDELPEVVRQLWIAERADAVAGLEGVPFPARHAASQNLAGRHFTTLEA
ncbi:MAG: hypothetical protein ACRDXX_11400, partial [Stackebrandtia sp.]